MAETQAQINESLVRIINLSSTAKRVVDNQSYLMSFPNAVTDNDDIEPVRQEAFVGLVEDMATIGLYFTCPNEQIYSDNDLILSETLDVLEFLMPNGLYRKMQQFPKLVEGIQRLLHGIDDDPILQSYLAFLGGLDNTLGFMPALQNGCAYLWENMRSEALFGDYLEHMISLIHDEHTLNMRLPENMIGFNLLKSKLVQRAARIYDVLTSETFEGHEELTRTLYRRLDINLTKPLSDPMQQNTLVFLYLSDPNTMGEETKAFFDKKWAEYRVSSRFFPEYFAARNLPIMPMDVLGFCIYAYCTTDTSAELLPMLEAISEKYVQYKDVMEDWFKALLLTKEADGAGE